MGPWVLDMEKTWVRLSSTHGRWDCEVPSGYQRHEGRRRRIPGACWPVSRAEFVNSWFNERPCLKRNVASDWGRHPVATLVSPCKCAHTCAMHMLASTCMHTHTHAHTCMHTYKIIPHCKKIWKGANINCENNGREGSRGGTSVEDDVRNSAHALGVQKIG